MMMMMRGETRIRPEETGPINWILFCQWLDMRWDLETCGGFLILPSKMVEVRVLGQIFDDSRGKISSVNRASLIPYFLLLLRPECFLQNDLKWRIEIIIVLIVCLKMHVCSMTIVQK